MAILSAIASRNGSSLLNILHPLAKEVSESSSSVQISALIDSYGSPSDTAFIASNLVAEGFTTIKIKVIIPPNLKHFLIFASIHCFNSNVSPSQVARREDPDEDIAAIQEVRRTVGKDIILRVDANRKWSYDAAVKFANGVKDCGLQYIEV